MNATAPLVVAAMLAEPSQDANLLQSHVGGQPLHALVIRTMAGCREACPVLVTDLPEAAALARKLGVAALAPERIQGHRDDSSDKHPPFGLIARTLAAHGLPEVGQTPVAVLDWRWPLLSADTISHALKEFRRLDPPLLASVSLTADNPVQAQRGFRILDAGTAVFLEDHGHERPRWLHDFNGEQRQAGNEAPYLATRPFFLDWTDFSLGNLADGSIAALCWLAYAPDQAYFFIPREQLADSYHSQSVVLGYYRRESRTLARHLVSTYWLDSVYPRKLAGLDPLAGTSSPGAICLTQGDSLLLCLPGLEHHDGASLRVWPFRQGAILAEQALEISLGGQEELRQFLWNQAIHLTARLPGEWPDIADGFCYALLVPDNREADFMEPLIFQDGPYRYDSEVRTLVTAEGARITGRQHFAPLRTLNTALTVLRFQDLPRGRELLGSEDVAVFALPEAQAQSVENEIDLARIG